MAALEDLTPETKQAAQLEYLVDVRTWMRRVVQENREEILEMYNQVVR